MERYTCGVSIGSFCIFRFSDCIIVTPIRLRIEAKTNKNKNSPQNLNCKYVANICTPQGIARVCGTQGQGYRMLPGGKATRQGYQARLLDGAPSFTHFQGLNLSLIIYLRGLATVVLLFPSQQILSLVTSNIMCNLGYSFLDSFYCWICSY